MLLNQCVDLLLTPQSLLSLFLLPAPVSPLCVITPYSWLLSPFLPPTVTEYCLSDTIQLCRLFFSFFLRSTSVHLRLRKQLAKHSGHKAAKTLVADVLGFAALERYKTWDAQCYSHYRTNLHTISFVLRKLQGPRASSSVNVVWHNASNAGCPL